MLTFVDVMFTSIVHEHKQERKFLNWNNYSRKPFMETAHHFHL